jgi:hypothetical protein
MYLLRQPLLLSAVVLLLGTCGTWFHSHAGFCGVQSDHCGSGCQAGFGSCSGDSPVPATTDPVPQPQPTPQAEPAPQQPEPSSGGVGALLSAQQWETLFPNRNAPQCECCSATAQL